MNWFERQLAITAKFGAAPLMPAPHERLAITPNIRSTNILPLNGGRLVPANGMCGWWLWRGTEWPTATDAFGPLHVSHLESWCPEALPYLQLPPGWRFLVAPEYEDVWFDPELLKLPR